MPTAPDPNSPYIDNRLQAEFGMRDPGTPSSVGKPGPQMADISFPAPPAVNAALPGRPSDAGAPVPPTARPKQLQRPTQAAAAVGAGGSQPAQPGAAPVPPLGQKTVATIDPSTGAVSHTLTPEGDMAYRQNIVKLRNQLGPIPRVFVHPTLPELPVEPGQWNLNPFTGQFTK